VCVKIIAIPTGTAANAKASYGPSPAHTSGQVRDDISLVLADFPGGYLLAIFAHFAKP
jgi:hypothetical protein